MCREHASTITNAHTVPAPARSPGRPTCPVGRSRSAPPAPAGGSSRSTVTAARRASSGRFAAHLPPQRRHRAVQPLLVTQPLMDRRLRSPRPSAARRCSRGAPRSPARSPAATGYRPAAGTTPPPAPPTRCLGHRRPARDQPGRLRRGQILAHRLAVHAQTRRHLALRPARIPVDQDLVTIRPRRTFSSPSAPSRCSDDGKNTSIARTKPTTTRTSSPWGIT